MSALESVAPSAAELAAEGVIALLQNMEWYTIEKARRVLQYAPLFNFAIER